MVNGTTEERKGKWQNRGRNSRGKRGDRKGEEKGKLKWNGKGKDGLRGCRERNRGER